MIEIPLQRYARIGKMLQGKCCMPLRISFKQKEIGILQQNRKMPKQYSIFVLVLFLMRLGVFRGRHTEMRLKGGGEMGLIGIAHLVGYL